MAAHVMQHANSPTWCIHCGTFDCYAVGECNGERTARYDSDRPENFKRMLTDLLGKE